MTVGNAPSGFCCSGTFTASRGAGALTRALPLSGDPVPATVRYSNGSGSLGSADYHLDDCGSLNGTYVNRSRIESHRLDDGDELQIGKYKLTFLSR